MKILATSREGLGVVDEQVVPVPSLDVGAGIDSAAVTLFVERARSVAPHFSISDEASAVVEICRRLDGIPLAIELAASRMVSMTAVEVADCVDQRFRLLVGSRRGQPRHQTLRHAVAWSYELFEDAEKALLECCSMKSSTPNPPIADPSDSPRVPPRSPPIARPRVPPMPFTEILRPIMNLRPDLLSERIPKLRMQNGANGLTGAYSTRLQLVAQLMGSRLSGAFV